VFVDCDRKLDFLDDDDLLLLAGSPLALFLLVEVAAVVLDAADRRYCVGRDFDEVKTAFAGELQRFEGNKDSELVAVFVDDADFAGTNPIINADKGFG
jgi:hypothetical protein